MTVPPLGQSIARARSIVTHVAEDEVWMSKRRMSNGAEAGSFASFAFLGIFSSPRDHACPTARFALSARPVVITQSRGHLRPCGAHGTNPEC